MQLRNGKKTNQPKKEDLIQVFKNKMLGLQLLPGDDVPNRIWAAHELYSFILEHIDVITSNDFDKSGRLTQTIYDKSFELNDEAYFRAEAYIEDRNPENAVDIRQMVDNYGKLVLQVQEAVRAHNPGIMSAEDREDRRGGNRLFVLF
jgi:hypothetical protein